MIDLIAYLKEIKKEPKNRYYQEAVEHSEEMLVHVNGNYPVKLIDQYRPHEDKEVREYRMGIYQPITKSSTDRVIDVINKILSPRMISIVYKDAPKIINPSDWIDQYMKEGFGETNSFINWMRSIFMRSMLADPNALCVVDPIKLEEEQTDFLKPLPSIVQSADVLDFTSEYVTIAKARDDKGNIEDIRIMDKDNYTDYNYKTNITTVYEHNLGLIPCFRLGGNIKGDYPYYYNSYISGILPHWNKYIRLSSDLDAGIVNHLYLEAWEYEIDCPSCSGGKTVSTKMKDGSFVEIKCSSCNGYGKITNKNPFNILTVKTDALNPNSPIPVPPKGYIDKPIDIINIVRDIIKDEEKRGYEAVNMDILNTVGENQSGVAKVMDRQDLYSFLSVISAHVYGFVIPSVIEYTMRWRYSSMINDFSEYVPEINIPVTFDISSTDSLSLELEKSKGLGDSYHKNILIDIISKRFANSDKKDRMIEGVLLNAYPTKTEDEMMTMLSNRVITVKDWYISRHIDELLDEAIDDGWWSKTLKEKRDIISKIYDSRTVRKEIIQ